MSGSETHVIRPAGEATDVRAGSLPPKRGVRAPLNLEATVSAPQSVLERIGSPEAEGSFVPGEEALTETKPLWAEKQKKKSKAKKKETDLVITETFLVRLQLLGIIGRSVESETSSSTTEELEKENKTGSVTEKQKDRKKFGKRREEKATTKSNYLGIQHDLKGLKTDCDSRGRKSLWLCHQVLRAEATSSEKADYVFESLIGPNRFLQVSCNGNSLETSTGRQRVKRAAVWSLEIDKQFNERRAIVKLTSRQFPEFQIKVVRKLIDESTLAKLGHKDTIAWTKQKPASKESVVRPLPSSEVEETERKEPGADEAEETEDVKPKLSREELIRRVQRRVEKKKFLKVERKQKDKTHSQKREKQRSTKSVTINED